ncbi:MAG: serine--tRNA ligase [Anaerolineae bacterium]|nr:serine--tRNA ligase [Anaerolineae bacterium]
MLDLKYIRDFPEKVREGLVKLNTTAPIDEILALDVRRRELLAQSDALKHRRNVVSEQIARMKEKDQALIEEMREAGARIKTLDAELGQVETELSLLLLLVPNMPDPSVPVGRDESQNVLVRTVGEPRQFDFEPLAHWDLGPTLDIIDFEWGVKISGSRFYVLKGLGARLQRALITWMLDVHVKEHGYLEVYPPFLVRSECLVGTGNLPKFADNLYRYEPDDLWMIPTAEVPVTNLHREEILPPGSLPIKYVAYTACFRREQMSAGRDTRGLKRGHQFDKVEMVRFVEPESSAEHLEEMVRDAERIADLLEIPHRVVEMCTGDLAFSAMKKYDVEIWAPGVQEWLEVSSCSNFGDFQARRANIRYRLEQGVKPRYVHTLNGSGLALPRVMIAVMENYQQADGSVLVPSVLRPYMDDLEVISGAA